MTATQALGNLSLILVVTGDLLLITAGVRGRTGPDRLRAVLISHRLIPLPWLRACVVRSYERGIVVVGAGSVLAVLGGVPVPAAVVTAAVFLAFTGYLAVLWLARGRVACGCLSDTSTTGPASMTRAALIVAGGGVCVWLVPDPPAADRWLMVAMAAFVSALVLAQPLFREARRAADRVNPPG